MAGNLREIADRVGVSKATVSLVLSGKHKGRVSERTRLRIEETTKSLNYTPNRHAKILSSGKTNSIGLIVEDFNSSFVCRATMDISERLFEKGFIAHPMISRAETKRERDLLELLPQRYFAGVICLEYNYDNHGLYCALGENLPLLVRGMESLRGDSSFPYVKVGYKETFLKLMRHLRDKGVERPAFISTSETGDPTWDGTREKIYKETSAASNFVFDKRDWRFIRLDEFHANTFSATTSLLAGTPRPDALILHRSDMAPTAYSAISAAGLTPGKDLLVAATDDVPSVERLSPSLTVVGENIPEVSAYLADTLLELIENGNDDFKSKKFKANLVIRDSTTG
jgi:LacI family transcriptional regulator